MMMNRLFSFFTGSCSMSPAVVDDENDENEETAQVKAFLQILDSLDDIAIQTDTIFQKLGEVAENSNSASVKGSIEILNREVQNLDDAAKMSLLLRLRSHVKNCGIAAIFMASDMFSIASRGNYVKEAKGVLNSLVSRTPDSPQKPKINRSSTFFFGNSSIENRPLKLQRSATSISSRNDVFERLCRKNH